MAKKVETPVEPVETLETTETPVEPVEVVEEKEDPYKMMDPFLRKRFNK